MPRGTKGRTQFETFAVEAEQMAELRKFLGQRTAQGGASWSIRGFISIAIREKLEKEDETKKKGGA
jgi:hypothetical protein